MAQLSAVILTKNEEANILASVKSVSFAEEILVIDDFSTDQTVSLAERHGARVIKHHLDGDFSEQRNFALAHAHNDWVLFIDADEVVSEELREEIQQAMKDDSYNGYTLQRLDMLWGQVLRHGEVGNIRLLRLGKKDKGTWVGKVHEVWEVNGKTGSLRHPVMHKPHQTIRQFLKEINYYTDIRAQELFEQKVKSNWFSIIAYPKAKFLLNYILRLGFLDGNPGLIFALMMSFHSFLVRSKLYMLNNHEKTT